MEFYETLWGHGLFILVNVCKIWYTLLGALGSYSKNSLVRLIMPHRVVLNGSGIGIRWYWAPVIGIGNGFWYR